MLRTIFSHVLYKIVFFNTFYLFNSEGNSSNAGFNKNPFV